MAEPLKNLIHPALVAEMADHLARRFPEFDRARFIDRAVGGMEALELMARAAQIRDALTETLPKDFGRAADILQGALPTEDGDGMRGWALLPVNQFVAEHGLADFDRSLRLLKALTPHFTAEFGIRRLIQADQARALTEIATWVTDPDHHVRRLASEGTRPRLPWAIRLPALIRDPAPILPVLEALIDDPSEYVRRSVANSLNDIAKDHPRIVTDFVAGHIQDASPERRQLLRHACRTLLKRGDPLALSSFGYEATDGVTATVRLGTDTVAFGDRLAIVAEIVNGSARPQRLMVDYAIHHRKANGTLAAKVFKWKQVEIAAGATLSLAREHAFRPITTRRYYAGLHRIDVLVNGDLAATADFHLAME